MKTHIGILLGGLLAALWAAPAQAQSTYVPFNPDYYHLVERYEIKRGKFSEGMHLSVKPYSRKGVAALADSVLTSGMALSPADRFNLFYLLNDNAEWADTTDNLSKKPFLKHFYKFKADLLRVDTDDFDLHVNPVIHFGLGNVNAIGRRPFVNTRGAEMRGIIAKRIGFYTYLTDTRAMFAPYALDFVNNYKAVPYEGFWKTLEETGNDLSNGVSFLTGRGYFTFDILKDKMSLQFGYDKNALGNGYRSLILSDFASNYTFMRLNTKVWKLNYSTVIAQMTADAVGTNRIYPKKYAAFHHLSINLTPTLNVGLFESVVYGRKDTYKNDTFELAYLNPIIFYRAVEQQLGSGDNSIIGVDFRWNLRRAVQLYGQLILDEFKIGEVRSGKGWWGNKQGAQLGLRYIDVAGIKNLDFQAEYNWVRPYTYSHFINANLSNHAHFNQALAHPLGANFREVMGMVRYQPHPRVQLVARAFYMQKGEDETGKNWGGNILLDNTSRVQEYDNRTLQGVKATTLLADLTATLQVRHNFFIDLKQVIRNYNSADETRSFNTSFTSINFRLNIQQRLHEF